MIKNGFLPTFVAAATLIGGMAMAQAPTAPPKDKDRTSDRDLAKSQLELRRASKIIGTKVIGSDNEKLGSIDNLAIDLDSGRVVFAVVSSGGVLGVGDKLTAVPCKALKFSDLNNPAKLNIDKTTFDAAPKIDKDSWNNLNDPNWRTTTYKHYNLEANWDAPLDLRTGEHAGKTATDKPMTMNLVKASEAIGMDVHNPQNDNLGDIKDLVVDVNRYQVVYSVLGFGGVLTMGEKLFAVPWQSLKLNRADKMFVLNVDKDKLKTAPGFDKDKWPDMTDPNWSQNVYSFYGAQPDWVYGYSGQGNTKGNVKANGWEADSAYNKMFNASKVETINGKVTAVDRVAPMSGMDQGVQLTIQTDKNQTVYAHLGPTWFIDQQSFKFNPGDTVKITGATCDINGKPCFMVTEVHRGDDVMMLRQKNGTPAWNISRTDHD